MTTIPEQARALDYTERLKVMLHRYAEWFGGLHLEDCPQDDTCSCEAVAETNALLSAPRPPSDGEAAELRRLADNLRMQADPDHKGSSLLSWQKTAQRLMRQAAARLDALEEVAAEHKAARQAAEFHHGNAIIELAEALERAKAAERRAERAEVALKEVAGNGSNSGGCQYCEPY